MFCLRVFTTYLMAASAMAQAPGTVAGGIAYNPTETKIAVLPVVDASGEAKDKLSGQECKMLTVELLRQFQERGFRFIDAAAIEQAIANQNVDLSDEEQRKRATMFGLGKKLGADLVAFVLFTDKEKTEREKRIDIKVWLLDVKRESAIMSARTAEGHGNAWRNAFPNAVQFALRDFLKPYPNVPKPQQQTSVESSAPR